MKIINSLLLLFIFMFCYSCLETELGMQCNQPEIISPIGYTISKVGTTLHSDDFLYFQFPTEQIGYALARKNIIRGARNLYKTMDGGSTWSILQYDRKGSEGIVSMEFQNELIGIISIQDASNCTTLDCRNSPILRITVDGGLTWEEIIAEEIIGNLFQLQFDSENLYGLLNREDGYSLVKSINYGKSWETIFSNEQLMLDSQIRKFKHFKEKFYLLLADGNLAIVSKDGELEKIIKLEENPVFDFIIIDSDNFIVSQIDQVSRSIDRGNNWNVIFEGTAKLGAFQSTNNGFLIIEQGICQSKYYPFQDAIAITKDGGKNWIKSELTTTNLRSKLTHAQLMETGAWMLSIKDELFILEEN